MFPVQWFPWLSHTTSRLQLLESIASYIWRDFDIFTYPRKHIWDDKAILLLSRIITSVENTSLSRITQLESSSHGPITVSSTDNI